MINKGWWRFFTEINKNIEDLIIWKLNQLEIYSFAFDCSNKDKNIIKLIVWLPAFYWEKNKREKLEETLKSLLHENDQKINLFGWDFIEEDDWLYSWKKFWEIELIGQNFLVLPCWIDLPSQYDKKVVLKIDPGAAFGTGGHPSTSLCLEMFEKTVFKEKTFLDVGCGSGILSIAAHKIGAKELHAIDNDYLALNSTKKNLKLNFDQISSFTIHEGSFLEIKRKNLLKNYDLICCNIILSVIKPLIPHFFEILNSQGFLILSGILESQKKEIIKTLNLYHFKIDNVLSEKDWICIKSLKLPKETKILS